MFNRMLITAAVLGIVGCSTSGTSVLIGDSGNHSPTDPASVELLIQPPERKHSVIALVEGVAATDDYLTKARTEAAAVEAMKEEAARIGAHAIVLTGKGSTPYGQMTIGNTVGGVSGYGAPAGFNASGYATTVSSSMGWEKITFSGTAIRYAESP